VTWSVDGDNVIIKVTLSSGIQEIVLESMAGNLGLSGSGGFAELDDKVDILTNATVPTTISGYSLPIGFSASMAGLADGMDDAWASAQASQDGEGLIQRAFLPDDLQDGDSQAVPPIGLPAGPLAFDGAIADGAIADGTVADGAVADGEFMNLAALSLFQAPAESRSGETLWLDPALDWSGDSLTEGLASEGGSILTPLPEGSLSIEDLMGQGWNDLDLLLAPEAPDAVPGMVLTDEEYAATLSAVPQDAVLTGAPDAGLPGTAEYILPGQDLPAASEEERAALLQLLIGNGA
jgi:hypothetical protein